MSTSQGLAFQGTWANFKTGETHVLYAGIGLVATGAAIVLVAWKTGNAYLAVLGISVMLAGVGIAVDVTAHGFNH